MFFAVTSVIPSQDGGFQGRFAAGFRVQVSSFKAALRLVSSFKAALLLFVSLMMQSQQLTLQATYLEKVSIIVKVTFLARSPFRTVASI